MFQTDFRHPLFGKPGVCDSPKKKKRSSGSSGKWRNPKIEFYDFLVFLMILNRFFLDGSTRNIVQLTMKI